MLSRRSALCTRRHPKLLLAQLQQAPQYPRWSLRRSLSHREPALVPVPVEGCLQRWAASLQVSAAGNTRCLWTDVKAGLCRGHVEAMLLAPPAMIPHLSAPLRQASALDCVAPPG